MSATERRRAWHVANRARLSAQKNARARASRSTPRTQEFSDEQIAKFRALFVEGDSSECWEWRGCLARRGYGAVSFYPRVWRSHRVAWIIAHGPIPDSLVVCHKCDNPPCVNPAHLFLGTIEENNHDMRDKGRARGLPGASNRNAKLTDADVRAIRAAHADGSSQSRIAASFNVSRQTISAVINHKRYVDVAA